MADQNITALPVATTPESSDQILLVGATEEKLIDYDKLADAILGKIASKDFALDQGNKTLLQALNELNSNLLKSENISDFDLKYTNENLRILYGLINGTAYISFDIFWIRIQFRSNLDNTFIRTVYGDSPIEEWTQIK